MKKVLRYIGLLLAALLVCLLFGVSVFVYVTLYVPGNTATYPNLLSPTILTGSETLTEWEEQKPSLLKTFEEKFYGPIPTTQIAWNVEKKTLDAEAHAGRAIYELWTLTSPDKILTVHAVVLIPSSKNPISSVVASSFCPNHLKFPEYSIPTPPYYPSMCEGGGMNDWLSHFIFGDYIDTYPFEQFVEHETALISIYLAEVVPDEPTLAKDALLKVSKLTNTKTSGTLAAWAWTYLEVARIAEEDPRFDSSKTALYGHSRDGKATLLAGAASAIPDLLLIHQSGKGGAAPWQLETGESIEQITTSYPHWFSPHFTSYIGKETELPVDQHQLLALLAPRPVLITGARLDKWDDPKGSLHAALEAAKIYALYGAWGPEANLDSFLPERELAFFMRPWFHGVQSSDWSAFFAFLEAHF